MVPNQSKKCNYNQIFRFINQDLKDDLSVWSKKKKRTKIAAYLNGRSMTDLAPSCDVNVKSLVKCEVTREIPDVE